MSKILVVDDEAGIRESLAEFLLLEGYEVETAADGKEALDNFWNTKPDLLILDAMMPRINGYEVCEILKEHPESRAIPILMLTGRKMERDRSMSHAVGADVYMTKPFHIHEVLNTVKNLLGDRS